LGANRVALGTDYPFPLGELEPGNLIESMDIFSAQTKELLLWKNAVEWLGRTSAVRALGPDVVAGAGLNV
jgi:aminocarboxymuconate-semialdehyde decarboxylase